MLIGGKGLARGYLGRPDLDSRSFVFRNGERYYATGDLAEVKSDGMTTIVGRTDSMVKIRGYSVYLGAIEETLRKHCDVSDAAVVAESLDATASGWSHTLSAARRHPGEWIPGVERAGT